MSFICGIQKIKQMNRYNKPETDSDIENKPAVTSGEREEVRGKKEAGD